MFKAATCPSLAHFALDLSPFLFSGKLIYYIITMRLRVCICVCVRARARSCMCILVYGYSVVSLFLFFDRHYSQPRFLPIPPSFVHTIDAFVFRSYGHCTTCRKRNSLEAHAGTESAQCAKRTRVRSSLSSPPCSLALFLSLCLSPATRTRAFKRRIKV